MKRTGEVQPREREREIFWGSVLVLQLLKGIVQRAEVFTRGNKEYVGKYAGAGEAVRVAVVGANGNDHVCARATGAKEKTTVDEDAAAVDASTTMIAVNFRSQ